MRFFLTIVTAALAVSSCFAAEVDGKWAGNINSPRGPIPMKFDLKTDAETVTGTAVGPQGEVPVSAGLFKDGKLTFQLRYRVADRDVVFNYEGVVAGEEMKMTLAFGINEPVYFVVKRPK